MADLAKSWSDRLGGVLIDKYGEQEGVRLLDTYQEAFGRGYEDRFSPDETLIDVDEIERTYEFDRLGLNLYELDAPDGPPLRFKIYNPRGPVALSDVLPMLEDFGLEPERFRLEWVSASEGPRFAQVMRDMVATIKELGPSPYAM